MPKLTKADSAIKGLRDELKDSEIKIEANKNVLRDVLNQIKSADLKSIQADNKLHAIQESIKEAEGNYKGKLASFDELNKGYDGRKETIAHELESLKADVADLKAKKRLLNTEIKERETYQAQQEAKVNEVVEAANGRIMDLNHEASSLETKHTQLSVSLNDMELQSNQLETLVRQKETQLAQLNEQYESVNRTYQQTLAGLKSRIDSASSEYKLRVEEGKKIVDRLALKEKELQTREHIIDEREYKVGQEEKMWTSRHRLYDKQGV